jgi:hypothetical protein
LQLKKVHLPKTIQYHSRPYHLISYPPIYGASQWNIDLDSHQNWWILAFDSVQMDITKWTCWLSSNRCTPTFDWVICRWFTSVYVFPFGVNQCISPLLMTMSGDCYTIQKMFCVLLINLNVEFQLVAACFKRIKTWIFPKRSVSKVMLTCSLYCIVCWNKIQMIKRAVLRHFFMRHFSLILES